MPVNFTNKILIFFVALFLIMFVLLSLGAIKTIESGNGFLFIPSVTSTSTATFTNTPTITPSLTLTSTLVASVTPTITLSPVPSATFDKDLYLKQYLRNMTATAEIQATQMVPTVTPLVADDQLVTGMRMTGKIDGAELVYIRQNSEQEAVGKGFWIDHSEISNFEYQKCVENQVCSAPAVINCGLLENYYSDQIYALSPVVNISWEQSKAYCEWAGMQLLTKEAWNDAARLMDVAYAENIHGQLSYPGHITDEEPVNTVANLYGNVWEWLEDPYEGKRMIAGGSWRSAGSDMKKRVFGSMAEDSFADDVGFRCILDVNK